MRSELLMLQAPTGAQLSSASNRVTYFPEKHAILGSFIYPCSRQPITDPVPQGGLHPLMKPECKCVTSQEYRQYCLKVTGCDNQGFFYGRPVQNEGDAAAVAKSTEAAPISSSPEDREAREAEAEEKLRRKEGFRLDQWPTPGDRDRIRRCAEQFVRLGRQAEEDALKQAPAKFPFLAPGSLFRPFYELQLEGFEKALKNERGGPKPQQNATETVAAAGSSSSSKAVLVGRNPPAKEELVCKHCQATFAAAAALDEHLVSKSGVAGHPEIDWEWGKSFECSYCANWVRSAEGLASHIWSKAGKGSHPTEEEQQGDEGETDSVLIGCSFCKRKFSSEGDRDSHLWSKSGESGHPLVAEEPETTADNQCPTCRRKCAGADGLEAHLKVK